jgi:hypothetical protein
MHLTIKEMEGRDAIQHCGHTVAYLAIGYESWAPLFAAAPKLLELAKQQASECAECNGTTWVYPDGEHCQACEAIHVLIAQAEDRPLKREAIDSPRSELSGLGV